MFKAVIDVNRIVVTNPDKEIITSGSVNVNFIQFSFSEDWANLQKTVLFQTKKAQIPIILEGNELLYTMPIPWEVCLYANESISIGAYGTRMDDSETLEDEEIVLPTVWGVIPDKVRQGVIITDPTPTSPTYNAYQLLLKTIADLIANGGTGCGGGLPGVSPTISVEPTDNGAILTIVDVNGEKKVTIANGVDGRDGENGINGLNGKDGEDGFSPTVSVDIIDGGHRLTIIDSNGVHTFDILDGLNGAGSDGIPVKPLTKTEYDALTDDEKNSETSWLVTNEDGFSNNSGIGSGMELRYKDKVLGGDAASASQEVYSTEETRIGTWIDGKPLYRKVILTTTPTAKVGNIATLDSNFYVVNLYGAIKKGDKSYRSIILVGANNMYANTTIDDNVIQFDCNITAYHGKPIFLIVEYTKDTDSSIAWNMAAFAETDKVVSIIHTTAATGI